MARRRRPKGPRFYIFAGEHLTVTPAPNDRLIVGRHRKCHIRIPDGEVNKKHAVIARIGVKDQWQVINFGVDMPTLFNGEMMEKGEKRTLEFGDVFEVGDYYFYFDRVRKDAPEEHREAFDTLIENEKQGKKDKLLGSSAVDDDDDDDDDDFVDDGQVTAALDPDQDDDEDGEDSDGKPKIKARRRRRRGLKSSARRRRSMR